MKMLNIHKIEKKFANILKRKGHQSEVYVVIEELVYSPDWEGSKDYWVEIRGRCGNVDKSNQRINEGRFELYLDRYSLKTGYITAYFNAIVDNIEFKTYNLIGVNQKEG